MDRPLPSLDALVAFEAAARLRSFTGAARELHVTQSAVSHRIRALEADLGLSLFERLPRALRPTPAGARLQHASAQALGTLARAVRQLQPGGRRTLLISALPSFAAGWLLGRLYRFQQAHPGIELHLDTTARVADLQTGEVDVAIRYGAGPYRGLSAARLLGEYVFPVCAPGLARALRRPDDLRRLPLLHDEPTGAHGGWPAWLRLARVRGGMRRGLSFNDTGLLVRAAVDGQGVALARSALVESELAAGRLVQPFPQRIRSAYHYAFVTSHAQADRPEVRALRAFLVKEARLAAARGA